MGVFSVVIGALNQGFLQTLKLFSVTLLGSIPLGLLICFGSMNRWMPFHWLSAADAPCGIVGRLCRILSRLRPVRLLTRFFVWIIQGSPMMLLHIIIFFCTGVIMEHTNYPAEVESQFQELA